jgi:hypothetical protein
MAEQITLEKVLELVTFCQKLDGTWVVANVKSNCSIVEGNCGTVKGYCGTVKGYCGTVEGNCNFVEGDCVIVKGDCELVGGKVFKTINGCQWQYIETPKQKLHRLIKETGNQELIEAFNQLVDNNGNDL